MNDINLLVKEKLSEYLEFDCSLLFKDTDFLIVFGGAIRDIIADNSIKNITDIDILTLSKSRNIAIDIVEKHGYEYVDLYRPEMYEMYREIPHIFEPKTFIKGKKIIQFITPSQGYSNNSKNNFFQILSNVDLISSAVFYDGDVVYESIENSIYYIKQKYTYRIESNFMYSEKRIEQRLYKLSLKNFRELNNFNFKKEIYRKIKIDILTNNKYPQIKDYIMMSDLNTNPYLDFDKLYHKSFYGIERF